MTIVPILHKVAPVELVPTLTEPLRPLLKWAGGKRWLVPHLRPLWERHRQRRFVEPFCGGLAVTLGLMPHRALINDINPHLINFYRHVRAGLTLPDQPVNTEERYYAARDRFNALIAAGAAETAEAAVLFYYLNRTGYNGLCRFSRKGVFNVPFGRYRSITYAEDFLSYRPTFVNWAFTCASFDLVSLEPDDFVYADPPYDVDFRNYSQGGFSWAQQERLAEVLAAHPGPVVLSNQATERVIELYERHGFTLSYHHAPRKISSNGDRRPALEVVAMRNL